MNPRISLQKMKIKKNKTVIIPKFNKLMWYLKDYKIFVPMLFSKYERFLFRTTEKQRNLILNIF